MQMVQTSHVQPSYLPQFTLQPPLFHSLLQHFNILFSTIQHNHIILLKRNPALQWKRENGNISLEEMQCLQQIFKKQEFKLHHLNSDYLLV